MSIDHGKEVAKNDASYLPDKQFTGMLSDERVFRFVYNHLRDEVICVCVDSSNKLSYYLVELNPGQSSGVVKLVDYKPSDYSSVPILKYNKAKNDVNNYEPIQIEYLVYDRVPYLLVLRSNFKFELVRNFTDTYMPDPKEDVERFLPSFG